MKTIKIKLPNSIDIDEKEVSLLLAIALYTKSKLSLGQAAELVGLTKRAFIELLGTYGASLFSSPNELLKDLKNA